MAGCPIPFNYIRSGPFFGNHNPHGLYLIIPLISSALIIGKTMLTSDNLCEKIKAYHLSIYILQLANKLKITFIKIIGELLKFDERHS